MTTICVVQKNGVAAIAGDSLWTNNNDRMYIHGQQVRKIVPVADFYVGMAGLLAVNQVFKERLGVLREWDEQVFRNTVREIAAWISTNMPMPSEDDKSVKGLRESCFMIAGPKGIYEVDQALAFVQYERFGAIGSGRYHALGAMWARYDSGLSAKEIAEIGVACACHFDCSTGPPILSYEIPLLEQTS